MSNFDEVVLVATETQGESESKFRMPSGLVSQAKVPPESIAGVDRPRHKAAWYQATEKEMQGLEESKAFTVLDTLTEGDKAVGSTRCWVLSYKSAKKGLITKTKARRVAKGFTQKREGVDYLQTFAPTSEAASSRDCAGCCY